MNHVFVHRIKGQPGHHIDSHMNVGLAATSSCAGLPVREISSQADLDQFHQSNTFSRFHTFIQTLAHAVTGKRISECPLDSASAV